MSLAVRLCLAVILQIDTSHFHFTLVAAVLAAADELSWKAGAFASNAAACGTSMTGFGVRRAFESPASKKTTLLDIISFTVVVSV